MRRPSQAVLVLLAALSGTVASSVARGSDPPDSELRHYEVWYRLKALVRSPRIDADIRAGGRLLMSVNPKAGNTQRLSLVAPLEDPWKLYWVDPLGPFGQETKVAMVTALPQGSWDALATTREKIERIGREHHTVWLQDADPKRPLDGVFGFLVIGPARDRFAIDFAPEGTVEKVTNRLTDRWLPGPFDQFVGREAGKNLTKGYWFWNDREAMPPDWEPHTYRALAAALELLALPLPDPQAGEATILWEDPEEIATRVLATLAPKARLGGRTRTSRPKTVRAEGRREGQTLSLRAHRAEDDLLIDRRTTRSSPSPIPESDHLRLEIQHRTHLLVIEVGYQRSAHQAE